MNLQPDCYCGHAKLDHADVPLSNCCEGSRVADIGIDTIVCSFCHEDNGFFVCGECPCMEYNVNEHYIARGPQ